MLELLRRRYCPDGNGQSWALMTQVGDATGYRRRTADAVAMSLWPSRGLHLHGFEIKVDRRDWLRELKKPAKAEPFVPYFDYWWLVVSDRAIVENGELPPTWGLMVARGTKLVCEVQAPKLQPESLDKNRKLLAALLRSAVRIGDTTPDEIRAAVDAAVVQERDLHESRHQLTKDQLEELRKREERFREVAGLDWFAWANGDKTEEIAQALRSVLEGERDLNRLRSNIRRVRDDSLSLLRTVEEVAEKYGVPSPASDDRTVLVA